MKLDLTSTVRGAPWTEPVSVAPTATVRHVARILARYHLGAVVVRPDDDAAIDAGIVTERDIVRLVAAGDDPDRVRAHDVMAVDLVTVDVGASLGLAVHTMVAHGVRHLAVVDGDEIVGVLSARDLLAVVDVPPSESEPGPDEPEPEPHPHPHPEPRPAARSPRRALRS